MRIQKTTGCAYIYTYKQHRMEKVQKFNRVTQIANKTKQGLLDFILY